MGVISGGCTDHHTNPILLLIPGVRASQILRSDVIFLNICLYFVDLFLCVVIFTIPGILFVCILISSYNSVTQTSGNHQE